MRHDAFGEKVMRGGRQPARNVRSIIESTASLETFRGETARTRIYLASGNNVTSVSPRAWRSLVGAALRRDLQLGKANLAVQRIRVKNNLILFYPQRSQVVKVFADEASWRAHVNGVSTALASFRTLQVVSPTSAELTPVPWVEEQLIRYPQPDLSDVQASLEALMKDLVSLHLHEETTEILQLDQADLVSLSRRAADEGLRLPSTLQELMSTEPKVEGIRGFCHGDLSRGNMLRHPGGLMLIDWEQSGPDWVVVDLLKVTSGAQYDPSPAMHAYASVRFPAADQRSAVADLHRQAALYLAKRFADGKPRRDYFVQRGDPLSYPQALATILNRIDVHLKESAEMN